MANKTKEDDINTINYIINQIDVCSEFIKDLKLENFILDIKTCYAVSMALQVICENSNKITNETKNKNKSIEWKKMSGLRNLISHDYGAIMFEDMYNAVINDLPILKNKLIELKNSL